jgi:uncharacterized membrane protein YkvA (DUF1232 family)
MRHIVAAKGGGIGYDGCSRGDLSYTGVRRFAAAPVDRRSADDSDHRTQGRVPYLLFAFALGSFSSTLWRVLPAPLPLWAALAVAALAAAIVYVVSPVDLIPDFLVPLGFTDDVLALALTWGLVKRELRDYCQWKGLSPAHFGL